MANRARGEIEIQLGGKTYTLAPTVSAILEIEEAAGSGIGALLIRFMKSDVGLKSLSAIVYGGIIGSLPEGDRPSLSFLQVAELIRKDGLTKLIKPCGEFLTNCTTGDDDEKEEPKPGEARTPEGG